MLIEYKVCAYAFIFSIFIKNDSELDKYECIELNAAHGGLKKVFEKVSSIIKAEKCETFQILFFKGATVPITRGIESMRLSIAEDRDDNEIVFRCSENITDGVGPDHEFSIEELFDDKGNVNGIHFRRAVYRVTGSARKLDYYWGEIWDPSGKYLINTYCITNEDDEYRIVVLMNGEGNIVVSLAENTEEDYPDHCDHDMKSISHAFSEQQASFETTYDYFLSKPICTGAVGVAHYIRAELEKDTSHCDIKRRFFSVAERMVQDVKFR